MFCIIAFIIFLFLYPILGLFSRDYRILFGKSFSCVFKKVTLKPCDIDLKTEIKGKLIGKALAKNPRFIRFFDKSFDIISFIFVALSIWSLVYTVIAGINLYVYDTCSPTTGESCSLSGEACGVSSGAPTFSQALEEGRLGEWAVSPFTELATTISRIPNRTRNWNPDEFTTDRNTYYSYDESRPDALEIIDPGCSFCRKLYGNIKAAGFEKNYNLTYLVYPIPDESSSTGYKFQHSYLISQYLEATKQVPPAQSNSELTPDWFIIDALFTREGERANTLQEEFNLIFGENEAREALHDLLREYGYTEAEIAQVQSYAASDEVKEALVTNKLIVENDIATIRIPTIMFDGRRYDRLLEVDRLK